MREMRSLGSAAIGIDTASGATVWRTERPVSASWSSPVVVQTPSGPLLLTAGVPWVIAYDPEMGSEIWRCNGLGGDLAPSPVYAAGRAFVTGDGAKTIAIPADRKGDVTADISWSVSEVDLSDASSPLATAEFFLQATSGGVVTCQDAATGKVLWTHKYPTAFWASPVLAGDVVYLSGEDGRTYLFKLAAAFTPVAENALGEAIYASPAFGDGRIIIRAQKHLICIAAKK